MEHSPGNVKVRDQTHLMSNQLEMVLTGVPLGTALRGLSKEIGLVGLSEPQKRHCEIQCKPQEYIQVHKGTRMGRVYPFLQLWN